MRLSVVLVVSLLAGCHGGNNNPDAPPADAGIDALTAPVFRNPLPSMTDTEVALASLKLLGGQVSDAQTDCNQCHAVSRTKLHQWKTMSTAATSTCLTDLGATTQPAAAAMLACLQDSSGHFSPGKAGMYAIAAKLPWFEFEFHTAFPADATQYDDFIGRVAMPRGTHPALTQSEFDIVAEWIARGMPLIDTLVPDENSGNCTPSITAAMASHTTSLKTTGWTSKNLENGLNMFGCAGATTPRDCLATYPLASTTAYGANWADDLAGTKLRVLRVNHYESSYWTRSSPDGRFVAHGGGQGTNNSTIIDLKRDAEIGTTSYYDPGFFPDNSGFAFQGSGPHLCSLSLLTTGTPTTISYTDPKCTDVASVGLYQHLGAAIGGDYWTVNGQWQNDNGAYAVTDDTVPDFGSDAYITLTPMTNNGTTFVAKPQVDLNVPFEGDTVISPSSTLLVSRVKGPGQTQAGYRVHALVATPSGPSYTVDTPVIATYCSAGDKPAFSFDERYMVFHHYVTPNDAIDLGFTGPSDPNFAPYLQQHTSNIYVVDLATGGKTRITRMKPGQFALFPHFRSDGWIYFMVRSVPSGNTEYVVASDAALMLSAP
jgi:hypothetical protein